MLLLLFLRRAAAAIRGRSFAIVRWVDPSTVAQPVVEQPIARQLVDRVIVQEVA